MAERNTYFQDEVVEQEKIDIKNLRRLLRYALPHKKLFIFVIVIMLLAVVSSMITPLLLKYIVDTVIPEYSAYRVYSKFFLAVAGFILCGFADIIITYFQQRSLGRVGHGIIADIRKDIFYKLQLCCIAESALPEEDADFFGVSLPGSSLNILKRIRGSRSLFIFDIFLGVFGASAACLLYINKSRRRCSPFFAAGNEMFLLL